MLRVASDARLAARNPSISVEVEYILLAAAGDTNPKRQRGLQLVPSLTLRVSVGCSIPDRAEYNDPSLAALFLAVNHY